MLTANEIEHSSHLEILAVADGETIEDELVPYMLSSRHAASPDQLTIRFRNATFVKCDGTSFESQLNMFKVAKASSPSGTIDVVVACAGIAPDDTVHDVEGERRVPGDLR